MHCSQPLFFFFLSDDKVCSIYRDEYGKETGLCQGELVSEVFFDKDALMVSICLLFIYSFVEAG